MELANPRAAINSGSSTSDADNHRSSGCESDFGFAFDDSNFSDRISRVEIVPDLPESKSDGEGCSTIADWARNRKRREEIKKENGLDVLVQADDQIATCNMPDTEEGVEYESLDGEAVAMIEESPSVDGDETLQNGILL